VGARHRLTAVSAVTVIDELTDALIGAVALGACATHGTSTHAIRRATAALRCLQLGPGAGRGRR
jgi:hypothetical protein